MNEAKFSGRRVVTRINEQGRSVIGLDGPPAEAIEFSLGGGLYETTKPCCAGDVVIQRGTNHAWMCEGPEPALLVAVLIDKTFSK